MKAKIIGIINNKGGVGKTATVQNLSAALADKGYKVCMIDCDSQHNLTNRCENLNRNEELKERQYNGYTIEEYLSNPVLEIQPLEVKQNLFLIPSTIKLAQLSVDLYKMKDSENPSEKLKNFCNEIQENFDFIIIDSEPGMGALMVNTAKAAEIIIIPINCQDALKGACEGVFGIMDANHIDTPYYFLQTMFENRLKTHRDIQTKLIEEAYSNTLHTYIKRNEFINVAACNYGLDIFEYAPKSGGANDYRNLASEVISILNKRAKKS